MCANGQCLAEAALVDELSHRLQRRVAVGHVWLDKLQHVEDGLVHLCGCHCHFGAQRQDLPVSCRPSGTRRCAAASVAAAEALSCTPSLVGSQRSFPSDAHAAPRLWAHLDDARNADHEQQLCLEAVLHAGKGTDGPRWPSMLSLDADPPRAPRRSFR